MFPTAPYDIFADRYTPHSDYLDVQGFDFTGATCAMEIRDQRNGGTVRATLVPGVTVTTISGVINSRVAWAVPEVTMEGMPVDPSDPTKDVTLYYDLHLTPASGSKFVLASGKFIVKAGVTQ